MNTSDIFALLMPGIRKAARRADAGVSLVMDLETNSLWLSITRANVRGHEFRLLLTESELEDGLYQTLFDQRLQEIFG